MMLPSCGTLCRWAGGCLVAESWGGVAVGRHCGKCNQPFSSPPDCGCPCHWESITISAQIDGERVSGPDRTHARSTGLEAQRGSSDDDQR